MSASPKTRVYMACSLDGFVAGPDHDLSFLSRPGPADAPPADPEALGFVEFMGQVGAMLMGRKTYDVVAAMGVEWPYGDTPVIVATNRPLEGSPATVSGVSGDIGELVAKAKVLAGDKDLYLDGGALVRAALDADLVDELCLTVLPILLGGEGVSLFAGLNDTRELEFVSHRTHEQGMVQLTARRRA